MIERRDPGGAFLLRLTEHPLPVKLARRRSVTFWFGILVIGFICWGWWHSMTNHGTLCLGPIRGEHGGTGVILRYNPAEKDWSARNRKGLTLVEKEWQSLHKRPLRWEIYFATATELHLGRRPSPWQWPTGTMNFPTGKGAVFDCAVFIPHWLILLAFALPWSALLLWRARRGKRTDYEEA
jgi:hypothetical protein